MVETTAVARIPTDGGYAEALPGSAIHARVARAQSHYTTPQERELAIANLKWMSVYAPSHVGQVDCRMLLVAMRSALLQSSPHSPETTGVLNTLPASTSLGQAGDLFEVPAPS